MASIWLHGLHTPWDVVVALQTFLHFWTQLLFGGAVWCMWCVCVCTHLETGWIFSRGCQGHQWVWHQQRHSLFACDMKKGRFLHVPAAFVKLLNKLLSYGVFTSTFDVHPTNFRPIFDQVSTRFRSVFDSLSIGFRTVSTTPLRRTMTTRTMFVIVLNEAYFISMPYFALYQTNM